MYCRNRTSYVNFKLKPCTCAQSHTLGTCTKFQLEILTINLFPDIVYFHEIILESNPQGWWVKPTITDIFAWGHRGTPTRHPFVGMILMTLIGINLWHWGHIFFEPAAAWLLFQNTDGLSWYRDSHYKGKTVTIGGLMTCYLYSTHHTVTWSNDDLLIKSY